MNNTKKKILIILLLVSIFSCKTDLEKIRALSNKEELPDVIVENLNTNYSINGSTQVILSTPKAYKYTSDTKQYTLFPDGINLRFYDKDMNMHSSLVSDYAIYYEKKKFAKASGNVVITNLNGSVLKTEEIFLDEKEEKIYSVVPVNIKDKDGFEITGEGGFESNLDFTVYRFTDVSGVKIIKDEENKELTEESSDNKKQIK